MPAAAVLQKIHDRFGSECAVEPPFRGDAVVAVAPERVEALLQFLRDEPGCEFGLLIDICGVDRLPTTPRFEVIYNLYSLSHNHRLRVRVQVAEAAAALPSVTALWPAADWFEREVWDMFGIVFTGHPNLKRLLLYDEFEGHPLRKDYPIAKRQAIPKPKEIL